MLTALARKTALGAAAAALLITVGVHARQEPRAILTNPGLVNAAASGTGWWLANDSLSVTWEMATGIRVSSVYDRMGGRTGTNAGEAFTLALPDGRTVKSSECKLSGTVANVELAPAGSSAGKGGSLAATFDCADGAIQVRWQAELRPGADAVVQRAEVTRGAATASVADVGFQLDSAKARPAGSRPAATVIAGPYLQNPSSSSMTVMWVTDGPAAGWVEYGVTSAMSLRAIPLRDGLVDSVGRVHTVRIDGLRPDTDYGYRIVTRPITSYGPYKVEYGELTTGVVKHFRTLAPAKPSSSFLVMNDLHENVDIMRAHLRREAAKPFDLVFYNGDSLSHLQNESQILERNIVPAAESFAGAVPFVFVRGNHETRGAFARELKNYFAQPSDRYYGSFDHGGVHFIVLDTGEDKEDSHWAYSGLTDFEAYRAAEAEWLKAEVQTPAFKNATFRVLIAHMPFYGNQRTRVSGYGPESCLRHFGAILNASGLDLHIAGHTHRADWVEPTPGANRFPISVGGGSTPGANTITRVDVSSDRLVVTLTTDDGKVVSTHTVMAKKRAK